MVYGPLQQFIDEKQEDIRFADELIEEFCSKGTDLRVSQVIDWFNQIDVAVLRDRAQLIARLGAVYDPYETIFRSLIYGDAQQGWSGKGADAFFRYCTGYQEKENSFGNYLDDVKAAATAHYTALNLGDGAGGFIEELENAQVRFHQVVVTHIDGLKAKDDRLWGVFAPSVSALDLAELALGVINAAASEQAMLTDAAGALSSQAELMIDGTTVKLNGFGPVDTKYLSELELGGGGWRP